MPDVLIYADTIRSPELRHELPLAIPDPFLYVEREGERHVVLTSFEIDRVREIAGAPEAHAYEEFGYDDLIAQGLPRDEVLLEVTVNAVRALGVTEALVPWTFPAKFADRLREVGVQVTPELNPNLAYSDRGVAPITPSKPNLALSDHGVVVIPPPQSEPTPISNVSPDNPSSFDWSKLGFILGLSMIGLLLLGIGARLASKQGRRKRLAAA